mmetsp:Transcript_18297/g.30350  ORF Transcript_18297/g.30350 Transcript_18297/m.30350 type:complete len:85 (-) Transcript_18297:1086-1340(-)
MDMLTPFRLIRAAPRQLTQLVMAKVEARLGQTDKHHGRARCQITFPCYLCYLAHAAGSLAALGIEVAHGGLYFAPFSWLGLSRT